jgi:glycerate-2-kinase
LAANDRWYLVARTVAKNVKRFKNVQDIEIASNSGVTLVTEKGREHLPEIGTIVFASERRSDRGLAEIAKSKGYDTHIIGDAFDVTTEDSGTIFANIAQAYDIARRI